MQQIDAQSGTYWYHSHIDGQYPDGLRGPLIVHDQESPYAGKYDEELVLTVSDWYHDQMPGLIKTFISVANPTGAEPVPKSALMNDTQNLQISVQPGKTYLIHLVNMAAFAAQYIWIEDHVFHIVEVDGVWTEPAEADMIYVTAAQRYSILLTTKNDTSTNFAIVGAMDQELFDKVPSSLNPNVTSYLVYNSAAPLPEPALLDTYHPFDDFKLVPADHEAIYAEPGRQVSLDVKMDNLGDGANYAFFNDVTYVRPKVPSLYTALTTGDAAIDSLVYGVNTNSFVLGHHEVVEIVVNNHDRGKHPFHLHGHNFQVVARSDEDSGDYNPANTSFPAVPMKRDTVLVRPNGHVVLRLRSDNPGVWLFHCHIEWHVDSGLIATMVEAPLEMQRTMKIPEDHYAACAAASPAVPTAGNAAANTIDFFDLEGTNMSPLPLPAGFTAGGIAALIFSTISASLGVAAVAWYGLGEISPKEVPVIREDDAKATDDGSDEKEESQVNMGTT